MSGPVTARWSRLPHAAGIDRVIAQAGGLSVRQADDLAAQWRPSCPGQIRGDAESVRRRVAVHAHGAAGRAAYVAAWRRVMWLRANDPHAAAWGADGRPWPDGAVMAAQDAAEALTIAHDVHPVGNLYGEPASGAECAGPLLSAWIAVMGDPRRFTSAEGAR